MVGFPSETDKDFQDTLKLIDELKFDFTEPYLFEPRPNTKAAEMNDQIPLRVARRRYFKLYAKILLNKSK